MSEGRPQPGTVGAVLMAHRLHRFVGRAAEVELFRAAMDRPGQPVSVLHLHGPGGVGKSTLLRVLARHAEEGGARAVRLDARDPRSVRDGLASLLHEAHEPPAAPQHPPPGARPVVLLLDSYERMAAMDDWVRAEVLPRLPVTTLTVLASRAPPGPEWRADPAWRDLLQVVPLRNLTPSEGREHLARWGVDPVLHERLLALSHGHPLALSLMADVVVRGGATALEPALPDIVGTLLRRFVDVVPGPEHRRALEVCALARTTTEALLREALEREDAHGLFRWLQDLPFVESCPDGLCPHELARDVLDHDLRWRDPEEYRGVFRRVRAHAHRRAASTSGREQQRAVLDEKFVFRNLPGVSSPVDWGTWGDHDPEPARPEDREAVLDLVAAAEGRESAALAGLWFERQREAFVVLRERHGGIRGALALLELSAASEEDRSADPGALAAWQRACRGGRPRPGEVVTMCRFLVDRLAYQDPSPTMNAAPVLTLQRYLTTPALVWDFLALAEPERWDDYFALADLPRITGADFVVGGRRYGLFGHDFRAVPVGELVESWTERVLAPGSPIPGWREREALALSLPEFTDCVRQALQDLHRPDLLGRNPLLRTRLLREAAAAAGPGAPESGAVALRALVCEAAGTLRHHPRDDKLWRAVHRTYLQPMRTQQAAARALGLPFSTYRRHLTQGVARVVAWCWEREVHGVGPPEPAPSHEQPCR